MNPGNLNKRITLQQQTEEQDASGQLLDNWADIATVWAAIEPLSGREFFAAQQVNSEVTTKIRIRYRDGIKAYMRIKYGERIFDIQSVIDPKEQHKELVLMCREVN